MTPNASAEKVSKFQRPARTLEVVAMDMLTPAGADAAQTAASVRAGINVYQASSSYNKQFNPMTLSLVPDEALPPLEEELINKVPGLTSRRQRMLQLATIPLQQLAKSFPPGNVLPLLLAGPEKLPGRRSVMSDSFLRQLQLQSGIEFDLENSYVLPYGRAAGFEALESAMLLIEQGVAPYIIVGAVDSYLDPYLLGSLDNEDRVMAEGIMDGFAPGEGAAFMLVRAASETSQVRMFPPGLADEVGHRWSSEPYKGNGLAEAVADALSSLEGDRIKTVLAGFNGEHFNTKEWGVASTRNSKKIDSEHQMVHPADCLGDPGAALGLILIQLGIIGLIKGYYQAPLMAWCSSELARRGAIYVK